MTKTFADHCIEMAEKATPKEPLNEGDDPLCFCCNGVTYTEWQSDFLKDPICDSCFHEFAIASRTDVPELARRLNAATLRLREAADLIHGNGLMSDVEYQEELEYIDSLEAMPEDKPEYFPEIDLEMRVGKKG